MTPEFQVNIAMSVMRALLGEITSNMRAVLVRVVSDDAFLIEFYIDGDVPKEFTEAASCIETEVIADFPDEFDISHKVVRLDVPAKVPVEDGILVFLRKEP